MVLIGCISVVGYSSLPSIQELFNSGIKIDIPYEHNVEYIRMDKKRTYRSLERLIADKKIKLNYPKNFSNGIYVETVFHHQDKYLTLDMNFNSYIFIEYDTDSFFDIGSKDIEIIEINGIMFYTEYEYYSFFDEKRYNAHAIIDGDFYSITCPTKELLAMILNCFEEE